MIERSIRTAIEAYTGLQKVSLLVGARRTGKTELLKQIFDRFEGPKQWWDGEDYTVSQLLDPQSIESYKRLLGDTELLIIDEATYIPSITQKAKLMIDDIKPLHIILSGSSSFDLVQTGAPLVGRSRVFQLYPLGQCEIKSQENRVETAGNLKSRLLFGAYPELWKLPQSRDKEKYLNDLVQAYLLKDILQFEQIRNAQKLKDLLTLLAHQVGQEVSLEELGRQLGMSKNTVERYTDLFQKAFVLYPLTGFSRNLRKEVVKSKKWYFWDNGIRNALIGDFSPLANRSDRGALWEQYAINELRKKNHALDRDCQYHFWRTYDQQEIDVLEVAGSSIRAFECKWNSDAKAKVPTAFRSAYPEAEWFVLNPRTYLDFVE